MTVRLTTDAPIDYVLQETAFNLGDPIHLVLGPDETLSDSAHGIARNFEEHTNLYWRNWSHRLALQPEWQEAVIRAAITLKLCSYEPTGAIVAAMTTSIPEAPGTGRNWDYRYCWVRDAYFVIRALTSLAAGRTLENYYRWIMNIVANTNGHIQPVYGIALEEALIERTADYLPGFQGTGSISNLPVRVGNQAYEHFQHDTYGNLILGSARSEKRQAFVESFGGQHLDASVLLMGEVGFVDGHDPRFVSTVDQLEKVLGRGPFMMRYEAADDFGVPETAFNICAFWRLDALARVGKKEQAREIFQSLLNARNHLGLMSEDTDPVTGAAWGNFPQTYSMVGIINGATRLSKPWEDFV